MRSLSQVLGGCLFRVDTTRLTAVTVFQSAYAICIPTSRPSYIKDPKFSWVGGLTPPQVQSLAPSISISWV